MTQAIEHSASFPVVRAKTKELLTQSRAFRRLPKATQTSLAHDLVKVGAYIAGGESGDNVPTTYALGQDATSGADLPSSRPQPPRPAGADFQAEAARQGGRALTDTIRAVNFPEFVAGLIDGVFNAVVDASIKQLEAFAELVKNVAKSVDQFMKDNVSENQARDYLANRFPDFIQVDVADEQPRAVPREDHDEDSLPDFFSELGLPEPVDSLDEDTVEEVLVPAARRRVAMDRQQLLATMVLMGINRIVVSDGNISASVLFRLDTRDTVQRGWTQTAEQYGGKYSRTRPGLWARWFRPSSTYESSFGRFKVATTQEEDSEAESKMKVELKGKVDMKFRSETFPLERMTDILTVNQIQAKAPTGGTQPSENEAQNAATT